MISYMNTAAESSWKATTAVFALSLKFCYTRTVSPVTAILVEDVFLESSFIVWLKLTIAFQSIGDSDMAITFSNAASAFYKNMLKVLYCAVSH